MCIQGVAFASWHDEARYLWELVVGQVGHSWFGTDRCALHDEVFVAKFHTIQALNSNVSNRGIVSYPYFSQSQLRSNLGPPDLSLGIDATLDLVRPSPAP